MEMGLNQDISKRHRRVLIIMSVFFFLLFFVFVVNIAVGSVSISLGDSIKIVLKHITSTAAGSIIWKIRLPRVMSGIFCGGYLAVAGLLLQVFFRNPIVGPFVLGISSGATLFVGIVMLAGLSIGILSIHPFFLSIAAFSGATVVMLIIVVVASRVRNVVTLLIIGLMMGYLCYSATSILIAFAEKESVKGFVLWQMGSFSGITWVECFMLVIVGIPLSFISYLMSKPLNALLLGEDYARTMGVNINILRYLIVIISSALSGIVTAFAGPVAFIGLAVPHMARLMLGTSDNRILIPGVFLVGAVVTILCDFISRIMFSPVELPLSAVTSFFGAPVVIGLLLKRRTTI